MRSTPKESSMSTAYSPISVKTRMLASLASVVITMTLFAGVVAGLTWQDSPAALVADPASDGSSAPAVDVG
jgi:hypothetical protein